MKLRFNGLLEKQHSGGGCNCKRSVSGYKFSRTRMFILPSGATKTFYVDTVAEVSDSDGEFLLGYKTVTPDGEHSAFTKVED